MEVSFLKVGLSIVDDADEPPRHGRLGFYGIVLPSDADYLFSDRLNLRKPATSDFATGKQFLVAGFLNAKPEIVHRASSNTSKWFGYLGVSIPSAQ